MWDTSCKKEKQLKLEEKHRFTQLNEKFFKALKVELEPTLRPSNPSDIKIYDATRVVHTRVVGKFDINDYAEADDKTKRLAKQAANHDGYKTSAGLGYATRFDYKPCLFVQSMAPSCVPKDLVSSKFCEIKILKKKLEESYDPDVCNRLLELSQLRATGCFNKTNFLGYRFWFFDLDYQVPVPFEDLCQALDDIGLFPYLAAIVQTSPGKYHLYFHSELIASQAHVQQWARPLLNPFKHWIYESSFVESIKEKSRLCEEWRQIAMRGMPNPYDMSHITTPYRKDTDGVFRGDNNRYYWYRKLWDITNRFFGGDPCVYNESRIAQLPFYKNPKSGFESEVMHLNHNAKVLTVEDLYAAVPKMVAYHKKHGKTINPYASTFKERAEKVKKETAKKVVEKVEKVEKIEKKSEKIPSAPVPELPQISFPDSRLPVPAGPEAYAKQNGLSEYICWDKDISGKSNNMLKALAKWAWKYIDLNDKAQREAFYDRVVAPYFKPRFSGDLRENGAKERFQIRFDSLCKTNLPYNLRPVSKKAKRKIGFSEDQIYEMFSETTASKLEEKEREKYLSGKRNKAIPKMLRIMAKRAYEVGIDPSLKTNKALLFDYFVPSTEFKNTVCGYNKYLEILTCREIIFRSKEFSHIRANGKNRNKCKNLKFFIPPEIAKKYLDLIKVEVPPVIAPVAEPEVIEAPVIEPEVAPVIEPEVAKVSTSQKDLSQRCKEILADGPEFVFPDKLEWDPQPEIDFSKTTPKEEKPLTAEEIEFEKRVQEHLKKGKVEIPDYSYKTDPFHGVSNPEITELKEKVRVAKEEATGLDKKARRTHLELVGYACFTYINMDIFEAKTEATDRGIDDYLSIVDEKMADRAHIIRMVHEFRQKELEIRELEYYLVKAQVKEKNANPPPPPPEPAWDALNMAIAVMDRKAEEALKNHKFELPKEEKESS